MLGVSQRWATHQPGQGLEIPAPPNPGIQKRELTDSPAFTPQPLHPSETDHRLVLPTWLRCAVGGNCSWRNKPTEILEFCVERPKLEPRNL